MEEIENPLISELVQLKLNIETSVGESTPTEAENRIPTPTYRSGSLKRLDKKTFRPSPPNRARCTYLGEPRRGEVLRNMFVGIYEDQLSSYEAQVEHYTVHIKNNAAWEYSGIYADEGISGTNTKKRVDFNFIQGSVVLELALFRQEY